MFTSTSKKKRPSRNIQRKQPILPERWKHEQIGTEFQRHFGNRVIGCRAKHGAQHQEAATKNQPKEEERVEANNPAHHERTDAHSIPQLILIAEGNHETAESEKQVYRQISLYPRLTKTQVTCASQEVVIGDDDSRNTADRVQRMISFVSSEHSHPKLRVMPFCALQ
nr:hypothetical protein [Aurantiacibacter rhizosphaerae]